MRPIVKYQPSIWDKAVRKPPLQPSQAGLSRNEVPGRLVQVAKLGAEDAEN